MAWYLQLRATYRDERGRVRERAMHLAPVDAPDREDRACRACRQRGYAKVEVEAIVRALWLRIEEDRHEPITLPSGRPVEWRDASGKSTKRQRRVTKTAVIRLVRNASERELERVAKMLTKGQKR
ncbi:MAG: hypothetical protein ACYS99_09995 [Planctomycetota bacterium]|jgi:hypothetical protein